MLECDNVSNNDNVDHVDNVPEKGFVKAKIEENIENVERKPRGDEEDDDTEEKIESLVASLLFRPPLILLSYVEGL